jgi:hypothetical protein
MTTARAVICCAVVLLGSVSDGCAIAQDAKPGKVLNLLDKLATVIETKDLATPMTLREMLDRLIERCAAKGVDLQVLVDVVGFKNENPDAASPDDAPVQLRGPSMTVAEALQMVVRQIPTNNGTLLLRRGIVEITTVDASNLDLLLTQKVLARFNKTPLVDVMRQLSEDFGISILADPRSQDKLQIPISAEFRGNMSVEFAVRVIADMADLGIAMLGGGLYVTTPANAAALEKKLRQRKRVIEERIMERWAP